MNKLNIIGLGYIGLPTALMFATHGVEVVGTDVDKELVKTLQSGNLTFEETGLPEVFDKAQQAGIVFQTEYLSTDRYIITVPTPYLKESKKLDAKYVIKATEQVLDVCLPNTILVIESTIAPGTIDKVIRPLIEQRGLVIGKDIHLVHAPERIIPGNMVNELRHNSRTIGADSTEVAEQVKSWYASFCDAEIVSTDIKTAEMSKVVENTFRDINIAFANELAQMCHQEQMDVYELINIANKHPRVNILQPGPGVGGHCISVDPWFLVGDYPNIVNVVLGAREVNDSMPTYVFNRIHEIMKAHHIDDYAQVGIYGMTYKENVDDIRESPTLQLMERFEKYNMHAVKLYDPYVSESHFPNQFQDLEAFLGDVKLVVVMVGHNQIKDENVTKLLRNKIVYDTKNCVTEGTHIYKI